MQHRLLDSVGIGLALTLAAGALAVAPAAQAAPANVTVRVEGQAQTIFPKTRINTDARTIDKDDGTGAHACDGTSASPPKPSGPSASGALDDASKAGGFTWAAQPWNTFGFPDFLITRIGPDEQASDFSTFWLFKINNVIADEGGCQERLQAGDDLLWYFTDDFSKPTLGLEAPTKAQSGSSLTVTVRSFDGSGNATPAQGAAVSGGGQSVLANAAGQATLQSGQAGSLALRATRPGALRSETAAVCVFDLDRGQCGTEDRVTVTGKVSSIANGARFKRGHGPRLLEGTVPADESGIAAVELSLRRHSRGRCSQWSGKRERFTGLDCTPIRFFSVGDREQWSYLLPRGLGHGKYVLDLRVRDKAGNVSRAIERGRNRVVFKVR